MVLKPRLEHASSSTENDVGMTTLAIRDGKGVHFPQETLRRNIRPFALLAVGFNIVGGGWAAIGGSLAIGVAGGGTVTVIYGILIASAFYFCATSSLAEMANVFPTAGGQYHFASIISPPRLSRGFSYICGMIAIFSWIAICAAATIIAAQCLLALPVFWIQSYHPPAWHYFLVYQAINIAFMLNNIFVLKRNNWIHDVGFILNLSAFLVTMVTCLALGQKQSSSAVWATFENGTGWPSGVTFLTGLITPCLIFAGIDACFHLAEEATEARKTVPRALVTTAVIGFACAFAFAVAMCYCITDLDTLLESSEPIYALWFQATGSKAASTVFQVCLMFSLFFTVNAGQQTTSRLLWSFGRDNGFLFSKYFAAVSDTWEVPIWCLVFNAFWVMVEGCIYVGSTVAFNAILSSWITVGMVSYAIPCALLLYRRRTSEVLPEARTFKLRWGFGWIANAATVVFAIIEVVFFAFPPALPVSGSSMNYEVVVFAVMALMAALNWFIHAKKHYHGPIIEYMDNLEPTGTTQNRDSKIQ